MITTDKPIIPAGNYYDKYATKNPIEGFLVRNFLKRLSSMVGSLKPKTVLEVGSGEGYVSGLIGRDKGSRQVFGCDISYEMVAKARANYPMACFFNASAYNLPLAGSSIEMIVASEVLEHLSDPKRALTEIDRVAGKYVLITVPREPLWRMLNIMRGKYISKAGNTPGHLQHWSRNHIVRLLEKYFDVLKVECPLPWIICLCRKKV